MARKSCGEILLLCLLACFGTASFGQARESVVIGPGDLLSVHVFREDELDARLRVQDAGTIRLDLIGMVPVAGLSSAQAAARIAQLYASGGFLREPQVEVFIDSSVTGQVAVLGEVQHPGTVPITTPRSLLDVLAEAGGLQKEADRHVTIRHLTGPPTSVFLPNAAAGDAAAAEALVSPGDTVLVPRAGIVYVLGDVGRPGGYLMQDDARLSLLQALALASGATRTASEGSARLIRTVHGTPTEIPLQLKAREKGRLPDLALQNDDIVFVPFSFGKNMALGATSIAASASSAVIYAAY